MNKFITAVSLTANLVVLQNLTQVQTVNAQTAQDLLPIEAIGLSEDENGYLEIPGVGGARAEMNDSEPSIKPSNISIAEGDAAEDLDSEAASSSINLQTFITPSLTMPEACRVNGFPLIVVCASF